MSRQQRDVWISLEAPVAAVKVAAAPFTDEARRSPGKKGCGGLSRSSPSLLIDIGRLKEIESTEVVTWAQGLPLLANYLKLPCSKVQCPPTITSAV